MATRELPRLIEPDQLEPLLHTDKLLLVDLSDIDTYKAYHLPGAIHLDYQTLTQELPEPGKLQPNSPLSLALSGLGLGDGRHIIVYDEGDNGKACRLLWSLDMFGHQNYSLLNGGLQAWLDERHPVESTITPSTTYASELSCVKAPPSVDLLYLLQHLRDKQTTIIDARTPAEYRGEDLRSQRGGHIPGAINIDHRLLLDPEHSNRLRPEKELLAIFKEAGIKPKQQLIVYCQSHRRSALLYFALKLLGYEQVKAYPGAWAEWGNNLDTPIE